MRKSFFRHTLRLNGTTEVNYKTQNSWRIKGLKRIFIITLSLENQGFIDEKYRKQYTSAILNFKTPTLFSVIKRGQGVLALYRIYFRPKISQSYICRLTRVKYKNNQFSPSYLDVNSDDEISD